jgi:thiol-disulfide isomerase/thioredoxin
LLTDKENAMRFLRISLISIALLSSLLLISCSPETPLAHDAQGKPVMLSQHQDKWLLINYWASWCQPCYDEFPELNAFHNAHQQHTAVVMGVNFELNHNIDLSQFAEQQNIQFLLLDTDPAKVLGLSTPSVLPATYVINPQGELVATLLGPQTRASLEKAIGIL